MSLTEDNKTKRHGKCFIKVSEQVLIHCDQLVFWILSLNKSCTYSDEHYDGVQIDLCTFLDTVLQLYQDYWHLIHYCLLTYTYACNEWYRSANSTCVNQYPKPARGDPSCWPSKLPSSATYTFLGMCSYIILASIDPSSFTRVAQWHDR